MNRLPRRPPGRLAADRTRRFERLLGTPRLVLAVALIALGGVVALTASTPVAGRAVVVAARELPAGAVLATADVALAERPADTLPKGALTALSAAVGQRAVGPVERGETITLVRLAPRGLAADLAPGHAVAAVQVNASQAAMLGVGDQVTVVAAGGISGVDDPSLGLGGSSPAADASPVTLADRARVLAIWPADPGPGATVALDVDVGTAFRLAVVSGEEAVGVVVLTA